MHACTRARECRTVQAVAQMEGRDKGGRFPPATLPDQGAYRTGAVMTRMAVWSRFR
jgi:hypothetical protein